MASDLAVGFKDGGGEARAARAAVKVTVTGRVLVQAGTCEIGQGIATALCQIAAEILNVPYEWVRYGEIDTDVTPYDQGTHASSGIAVGGNAVARAAQDVREQILSFAAEKLSCSPDELYLKDWTVQKGGEVFPLQPLAMEYFGGYGCEFVGRGFFKVDEDLTTALNAKRLFWMPNWIGIEVDVDAETGQYVVTDFIVGTDAGRIINAAAIRGQVEGGALQGLGQAMFETLSIDGEQLATDTPLKYRLPLANDLPERFRSFVEEHGMGPGPFGSKGIGESGILAVAAALANAIEDAVGVRITSLADHAGKDQRCARCGEGPADRLIRRTGIRLAAVHCRLERRRRNGMSQVPIIDLAPYRSGENKAAVARLSITPARRSAF